jgi:hypothetical protein
VHGRPASGSRVVGCLRGRFWSASSDRPSSPAADYRNQGFEQGLGSRSTHNLTYRALRRLNVEIPEMVDTLADECTFINESVG